MRKYTSFLISHVYRLSRISNPIEAVYLLHVRKEKIYMTDQVKNHELYTNIQLAYEGGELTVFEVSW